MFFCYRCGAEHIDEAVICTKCGCKIELPEASKNKDDINFWTGCLSYICISVPLIGWILGLILYLTWKESAPNRAKMVGILTLISVILSAIFWILYFAVFATFLAGLAGLGSGSYF
jgi:uncharacterized membrane protein YvbJ